MNEIQKQMKKNNKRIEKINDVLIIMNNELDENIENLLQQIEDILYSNSKNV